MSMSPKSIGDRPRTSRPWRPWPLTGVVDQARPGFDGRDQGNHGRERDAEPPR